jgi:isoquinoline 1-oxidoreductase beta subunit
MSRIGTIARRAFLIGSAAIVGGVAFGVYMVRKDPDNPLSDALANGEATFNPWVRISAEAITLITPHVDLGQGSAAMQALLIAEEMDLDLGQFVTEFGPPSAAYWNTALGEEGAPFRSTDTGFVAEAARTVMGSAVKLLGVQVTGGSSSTPDSFDKLRRAGAIARETLKLAASQETGVAVADLKTASAAVVLPDGRTLPYTALAARAAAIDPVTDVTLRDPSTWRLIGKQTQRLDIAAKSTGAQTYGIDLKIEGMVHAAVRVNPRRGAMNGYDAGAAQAMRGVSGIVPVENGVAVLADNTWRAIKAAEAITFDWAAAPYPAEQDGHWAAVAAAFTADRLDAEWRADGDVEVALATGNVVEAEYRAPYVAHQPLEPLNAIARVTDRGVEIWTSHQMPRFLQEQAAKITGHEPEQVTLHNHYAGGSFGHRLEFENVRRAVEIANQQRGTPVKLTYSREEDFLTDFPRQIGMARGRGTVGNGQVTAIDLQIATTSPSRSQFGRIGQSMPGPDNQIAAGAWNAMYALPNFRVRAYAVPELAPVSSWRSVGASSAGFFAEAFLDEVIHAAGADPLAERLRLADNPRARAVLEAVAEMSGWGRDAGPNRGLGVALVESFGVPVAEVVEVEATERGIHILNVWAAAEVGRVVDPVNFDNQAKGGIVWGLGHAMNSEIT